MLDSIIDLMDTNLSKLQEIVEDREAWHAAIHGAQRVSQTRLSDWRTTTTKLLSLQILFPSHFYLLFSWDPIISKIHYTLYIYMPLTVFSLYSVFLSFLHFSLGFPPIPSSNSLTVYSFQSLSRVWLFATPWTAACQASLSITNS